MVTVYVICVVLLVLVGMGLAVMLFGTGVKRARILQDIYWTCESIDGMGVLYTKTGEYSAVIKFDNPVQKYSADEDSYYQFVSLMTNVLGSLGEGYCLQKQDVFVRRRFHYDEKLLQDATYLNKCNFKYFDGREYVDSECYIVITQENHRSSLFSFDKGKWRDFLVKVQKVMDQLHDGGLKSARFLDEREVMIYVNKFFAQNFSGDYSSLNNFMVDSEGIQMGDRQMKVFSLLDVDDVGLPGILRPFSLLTVNNSQMPVDIMTEIGGIQDVETLVYNQILYLPNQKKEIGLLETKKNRHVSISNPGNDMAAEDITRVLDAIARENKQLVYCHFNLLVSTGKDKDMQKITNHLENAMSKLGVHISRQAYNQLELFVGSFPGNAYKLNASYDRFLTLADAALCLMFKERSAKNEVTPLKFFVTDRQGVPICIDPSGKEGAEKLTDNSNLFILGPSGSGKSFFTNGLVRQYFEQNTEIVLVDTGDSYENQCRYDNGLYITYSKEHPISMNPFKISITEYTENFVETQTFLLSLIFQIFKGNEPYTKIEEYIMTKVINEYYQEYFTPFEGFTDKEREDLREALMLQARKEGVYEKFSDDIEEQLADDRTVTDEDRERYEKLRDREEKLQRKIDDSASTDSEREAAEVRKEEAHNEIMRMTDIVEQKFSLRIDRRIAKMEEQRKKLRVPELCFNTFYEYAVQRIPEITYDEKISFPIDDFAAILRNFYKGGQLEYTLNSDMAKSLFDEKFIVFEIDKVKDDKTLFPIIVLIIMNVFTQKMRIKGNCRKMLIIEEAWKAISTPTMAEYMKYLYKTARKHWSLVGVVTQELEDIVGSPIVKEAIINNSGCFMLLDQSKFKDKFDEIQQTLALSDNDCKKIHTMNKLDNKVGRGPFKEVFIKRGQVADVFGIEESRECYMIYTTEKKEKEAFKVYLNYYPDNQTALQKYIEDWDKSGIRKSLDFATKVLNKRSVLNL